MTVEPGPTGLLDTTAIANGLPLFAVNPGDFAGIEELEVVSVPHPDAEP